MTPDPSRRIANRRAIIASLRELAATHEREAVSAREAADKLEAATDKLERGER